MSGAITAVGQTIALAHEENPTKLMGSKDFVSRLAETLTGWRKDNPAIEKKMPVEADVPELLTEQARRPGATKLMRAVRDCALINIFFLLRVGTYTVKQSRNAEKQSKQFKLEDCTFFKNNVMGQLRQLSQGTGDAAIMVTESANLELDTSKNGWKGVCVN